MILTLTIEGIGRTYLEDQCVRVIEIDENASLYDLHEAIQDAVGFGRDHPFEFFIANGASPQAHRRWLTEKEEWEVYEGSGRHGVTSALDSLGHGDKAGTCHGHYAFNIRALGTM